jgi:general secretion pathway protein J
MMRSSGEQGFTLVEMLVSLAILAMMATMMLGGLRSVGQWAGRGADKLNDDDGIVAAQRVLRERIEQMRAIIDRNSLSPILDATGQEDSFTFIAPPLARSEPDSLWRYRIAASATGDLILYTASGLDDRYNFAERGVKGWQPHIVLKNVQTIRINYFGERPIGSGSVWQVSWLRRPQPPALVRIRITLRPGDKRHWADLIVRPRATENSACKIDILTGRCGGVS